MADLTRLKRWRVFRAIVGYGVVSFALLQIIEPVMHGLHLPDETLTYFLVALGIAFPVVVVVSWALELLSARGAGLAVAGSPGLPAPAGRRLLEPASLALLAGVAALTAVVTLVAARPWAAGRVGRPRLSQLTFANGLQEFPAWSPDGKQVLYAAAPAGARVRKIFRRDLASGAEVQLTHGELDDQQPAWSPDGRRVLFVRAAQAGLKLLPGDVNGLYTEEGNLWVLDLGTGRETRLAALAYDPAWSPSGQQIAVDASWAGPRRIWILDAEGHNPQQATTDSSEAISHIAPRWSPDGRRIVFQNLERTKQDVRVVDLETKRQWFLTDDFAADLRPVWSPLGHFVYFSSDRAGGLNLWRAPVRADGASSGPLEQVTFGAGQDIEAALSPDGKLLAFQTRRQNADLWRLPVSPTTGLATGAPESVVSTTREDSRGAWSPDGRFIAFNSDRAGDMNVWLHSLEDGSDRPLTSGPGGDFQPNWSPDGKRLAFFSSRSGKPHLWAVEVASGKLSPLTSGSWIDLNPFHSPDGRSLAFQSDRSGRLEVWVSRADGSEPRQLTDVGVSGHFLRWTDDGSSVVFRCTCGGKPATLRVPLAGGEPLPFTDAKGGAHFSFSPDRSLIMDVVGHKVLWASPVAGGESRKVFEFPEPDARIDYPVWSPDGRWVLFDRDEPQAGNIWVMREFE